MIYLCKMLKYNKKKFNKMTFFFRKILIFSFLLISLFSYSQKGTFSSFWKTSDLGFFAGNMYYVGDINHKQQFYSPRATFGGIFRVNISPRYSIRLNAFYGEISGKDTDFDFQYQQMRNHKFLTKLMDYTMQVEFNFLPYGSFVKEKSFNFTPYIATGITFSVFEHKEKFNSFCLPFSVGFKYTMTHRIRIGVEWSFRRTYNDYLDALDEDVFKDKIFYEKQKNYKNNDDWYAMAGFFVSYKLFYPKMKCPIYDKKKFLKNFKKKYKRWKRKRKRKWF